MEKRAITFRKIQNMCGAKKYHRYYDRTRCSVLNYPALEKWLPKHECNSNNCPIWKNLK